MDLCKKKEKKGFVLFYLFFSEKCWEHFFLENIENLIFFENMGILLQQPICGLSIFYMSSLCLMKL